VAAVKTPDSVGRHRTGIGLTPIVSMSTPATAAGCDLDVQVEGVGRVTAPSSEDRQGELLDGQHAAPPRRMWVDRAQNLLQHLSQRFRNPRGTANSVAPVQFASSVAPVVGATRALLLSEDTTNQPSRGSLDRWPLPVECGAGGHLPGALPGPTMSPFYHEPAFIQSPHPHAYPPATRANHGAGTSGISFPSFVSNPRLTRLQMPTPAVSMTPQPAGVPHALQQAQRRRRSTSMRTAHHAHLWEEPRPESPSRPSGPGDPVVSPLSRIQEVAVVSDGEG